MFREIKRIEKEKIEKYIQMYYDIEHLRMLVSNIDREINLPTKQFNFFEKYITRRQEYKKNQEMMKKTQEINKRSRDALLSEIEKIEGILKKESMKSFGRFEHDQSQFEKLLENIEKATTFKELGYSSEEEVKKCLEERGIPIHFDSIEEGLEMFPEIACRDVEFMQMAVNCDFRNVRYDKTDDKGVYFIYLHRKLPVLETQSNLLKSKGNSVAVISTDLEIINLKKYLSELEKPKEVESGKYKIPHKFIFEELRNSEQPRRENSGYAANSPYNYLEVDGKFPLEYGKKLEEIYTRQDIVFGVHGTAKTDVSDFFKNGLRESTNYDRARQANNTVLYGEYLSFTNALDYGKCFGSNTVFILGLPKNAFSKDNPVHIWGSSERNGTKYILPEYILGYYMQGDANNRTVNENNEMSKIHYRYLHQDATVDKDDERVIDTEGSIRQ